MPNGIIEYLYNATGVKVQKKVTIGSTIYTTDYQNGYQYLNTQLQFFPHAEGYVNVLNGERFNYVYNYTDHLGNIRVSYGIDPESNVLKILEENHYYPFGLKHKNYGVDMRTYQENNLGQIRLPLVSEVNYKYKYNGKEWQDELGLNFYDYGARNYDAALGRWMNMDPLAENSRRWTPYNYAYNNPIVFVDPDGMQAEVAAALNEGDFDKMINVGYGREVAASSFAGAVESSGVSLKLNEEKVRKKFNAQIDNYFGKEKADGWIDPAKRNNATVNGIIENIPIIKGLHKQLVKQPRIDIDSKPESSSGAIAITENYNRKSGEFIDPFIVLFQGAFSSYRELSEIIVHEFGHVFSSQTGYFKSNYNLMMARYDNHVDAYNQAVYRDELLAYAYQFTYTGKPYENDAGFLRAYHKIEWSYTHKKK